MPAEPFAAARTQTAVCFLLEADPSPGLLPRLLQPFARRDLVPSGLRACRSGTAMRVEITMDAASADEIDRIEGNLHQIVGVLRLTRLDVACPAQGDDTGRWA